MAILQDTGTTESTATIASTTSSLKSDLMNLCADLVGFLHKETAANKVQLTPSLGDPIAEVIANLQDCRKLVTDIRHLAIEEMAKRITD